jgi:hypothetical protein
MTAADPLETFLRQADPAAPMPEGLAARIIAAVPQLPQAGVEPVSRIGAAPLADHVANDTAPEPLAVAPRRRYLVPLGLGVLATAAASLAAVFLSSAQGWQGPALAPQAGSAPAVAVEARPAPAPAAARPAALPAPELAKGGESGAGTPAIRPAVTPVLAQSSAAPVVLPADPSPAPQELAIHGDDAPIQQLSPAEAAAIERRAEQRAARETRSQPGTAPVAMGLRAGVPAQPPAPEDKR